MLQLLENFSLVQILTFIIVGALAIKQGVEFIDWVKSKIQKHDNAVKEVQDDKENYDSRITKLENNYEEITTTLNYLTDSVDLLIQSDRDDIKAYITREHHILCYEKGWVDDYTLDCLERRYNCYVEEHGNSFIEQLMGEIRALPKKPVDE